VCVTRDGRRSRRYGEAFDRLVDQLCRATPAQVVRDDEGDVSQGDDGGPGPAWDLLSWVPACGHTCLDNLPSRRFCHDRSPLRHLAGNVTRRAGFVTLPLSTLGHGRWLIGRRAFRQVRRNGSSLATVNQQGRYDVFPLGVAGAGFEIRAFRSESTTDLILLVWRGPSAWW
jgi:hypothetical protein